MSLLPSWAEGVGHYVSNGLLPISPPLPTQSMLSGVGSPVEVVGGTTRGYEGDPGVGTENQRHTKEGRKRGV